MVDHEMRSQNFTKWLALAFLLCLLIEWAAFEAFVVPHRPPARGPFAYTVTDLGTLGGPTSKAFCINNHAQVVGMADLSASVHHAFLWQNGHMADLSVFPTYFTTPPQAVKAPAAYIDLTNSIAGVINDGGWIVGQSDGEYRLLYYNPYPSHAVLWRSGMIRDLGMLPSYPDSIPSGMDAAGEVVGTAEETINGPSERGYRAHTFLFDGHATRPSSVLPWSIGMDDAGHIVGCVKRGHRIDVFLWRDGKPRRLASLPRSVRVVGFAFRSPSLIAGTLTYNSNDPSSDRLRYEQGVVWRGGRMRTLPGLAGYTQSGVGGINASGVVVGEVQQQGSYPPLTRAVLWKNEAVVDLNTLISPDAGWVLQSAISINDAGDIVGTGLIAGHERAFLLTPNVIQSRSSRGHE